MLCIYKLRFIFKHFLETLFRINLTELTNELFDIWTCYSNGHVCVRFTAIDRIRRNDTFPWALKAPRVTAFGQNLLQRRSSAR